MSDDLWRIKLQAWLHDPPEKAFVLFRGGKGHEHGTVSTSLRELLGDEQIPEIVREADRWAAAADRPDRPHRVGERASAWDRVRFPEEPVFVHPLSGQQYRCKPLDVAPEQIERFATNYLRKCADGGGDLRKTFLRLWRLGPDIHDAPDIRSVWRLMPADTRVPDHAIWDHLSLVSAIAAARQRGDIALLSLSIGPVQSFLEQGRSTHDLWAGSHLLSALAWEAMRPIVEELGPDAVVMPALRGNPLCDAWLVEQGIVALDELEARDEAWKRSSDAHPLFSASLPNRFLAIVPADRACALAERATSCVRERARCWALEAWKKIRETADRPTAEATFAERQIEEQLREFPEVHWAAARWSGHSELEAELDRLREALSTLGAPATTFESSQWKQLAGRIDVAGAELYRPNPGVLYPVVHQCVERALAAVKATRRFDALTQRGFRCNLCGEREWLAADEQAVSLPRGSGHPADPWPEIAKKRPAWARGGEHLCGVCTLKRLWPVLFLERSRGLLEDEALSRYVVSTHTMALVPVLRRLDRLDDAVLRELGLGSKRGPRIALPRGIAGGRRVKEARDLVGRFEDWDDRAARGEDVSRERGELERQLRDALGARVETYYALLLLDGDGMGQWIAGEKRPRYRELWHPDVVAGIEQSLGSEIQAHLDRQAPASPGYHAALSRAMADFATYLVPFVVEELCAGKVLYAGGDDVLAMLPVSDLVRGIVLLRTFWSGTLPSADEELGWLLRQAERQADVEVGGGHVRLRGRLFRAMGKCATCSIGAVVAHHTTPLGAVLHELRGAERQAKKQGRDRFCIVIDKRSGGTMDLVGTFGAPEGGAGRLEATAAGVLLRLQRLLERDVSRRAAYHIASWLESLAGASAERAMLASLIAYQLSRALHEDEPERSTTEEEIARLAEDLAAIAEQEAPNDPAGWLARLTHHAEFLARAERSAGARKQASRGSARGAESEVQT